MKTMDGDTGNQNFEKHFQKHVEDAPAESEEVDHRELVRRHLKVLLLHLAARSKSPGSDLEDLLHEVIDELHAEVKNSLEARSKLRLVSAP